MEKTESQTHLITIFFRLNQLKYSLEQFNAFIKYTKYNRIILIICISMNVFPFVLISHSENKYVADKNILCLIYKTSMKQLNHLIKN